MDLLVYKFIRILRVELEDLQKHLELLGGNARKSKNEKRTTERVTLENLAVFGSEKCGIESTRSGRVPAAVCRGGSWECDAPWDTRTRVPDPCRIPR